MEAFYTWIKLRVRKEIGIRIIYMVKINGRLNLGEERRHWNQNVLSSYFPSKCCPNIKISWWLFAARAAVLKCFNIKRHYLPSDQNFQRNYSFKCKLGENKSLLSFLPILLQKQCNWLYQLRKCNVDRLSEHFVQKGRDFNELWKWYFQHHDHNLSVCAAT